jgi:Cu2+-exporting ATPase
MNTETPASLATAKPNPLTRLLGQAGVSALALVALLVAAILDAQLWIQFGVVFGLIVLTGLFLRRVKKIVNQPVEIAEIQERIELLESQKAKKEIFANQVAKYWPIFVSIMAIAAVVLSIGEQFNIVTALTVFSSALLLTNAHAISTTIPMGVSNTLRTVAEQGIVIRNRKAFEAAAKLKLVLFTKSGVLTDYPSGVNTIHLASNSTIKDESKLLGLAASVESMSEHKFAMAIAKSARNANLKLTKPKNFQELRGYGVEGLVGENQVMVGSIALLLQRNIRMEVQELIYADESTKNGYSIVCVVVDRKLEGLLRFSDVVKPTAAEAVYLVAVERIRVGILTGDAQGTAQNKADQLDVSEVYAELPPSRKAAFVSSEQTKGSAVGVIGLPESDLEALRQADLSIALMGESEEISESADVFVQGDDPAFAAQVVSLSSRLRSKTNLGLGFALSYGVLSLVSYVAIVSLLLIPTPPAIAALIGSLSVLFVTVNAYSIGKLK